MNKKQIIWRELIQKGLENKRIAWTQQELAQKYNLSLSTVFNALKNLRKSNIIKVGGRGFEVIDIEKLLYFWATFRNLNKDILYQTHVSAPVSDIEKNAPPSSIFGAYTAFRKRYNEAPADYDKVYLYTSKDDIETIKERFPEQAGYQNLVVIEADPWLKNFGNLTPDSQTFVDLWNLSEWYAKDFVNTLKAKIV